MIGVFAGKQVANWNQERLEKVRRTEMLEQLRPEIQNQFAFFNSAASYFRTTRPYAEQALAGLGRDPKISDDQFVVAAYQANHNLRDGIERAKLGAEFGGNQMRDIDDREFAGIWPLS